jgi:hypothetical protein
LLLRCRQGKGKDINFPRTFDCVLMLYQEASEYAQGHFNVADFEIQGRRGVGRWGGSEWGGCESVWEGWGGVSG